MVWKSIPFASNRNRGGQPLEIDWDDEDVARRLVEGLRPRLLQEIERQVGDYLRRRVDREDILQSAFCSFFRRAKNDNYQFDHTNAIWLLLRTIVENKICKAAIYHTRKCRDIRKETGEPADELDPSDETWDRELSCVEVIVEQIAMIVDSLPGREAEFFRRRFVDGQTVGKIAADTHWSVSTVRRVLADVQSRIRDRIDSAG